MKSRLPELNGSAIHDGVTPERAKIFAALVRDFVQRHPICAREPRSWLVSFS